MNIAINADHPVFAVWMLLLAFATAWLLARRYGAPPSAGKFSSIEGLRGLLAFSVMIHHSCFWFFYLHSYRWNIPPSVFVHLGQASVAMFFMMTALLFFTKLLEHPQQDWLRLYVSRVLRLGPMHLFAIGCLLLVVFSQSGWVLVQDAGRFVNNLWYWLTYSFKGMPELNGVSDTFTIVAGVMWSLPYEWMFYFALPFFGLLLGIFKKPNWQALLYAILSAIVFWLAWNWMEQKDPGKFLAFVPGILAAFLARWPLATKYLRGWLGSLLVIFVWGLMVWLFQSSYEMGALALLGVGFVVVACGNTLFGLLTLPATRWLGRIGYSFYVLHGLSLFVAYKILLRKWATDFTPIQFWLVAGVCAVVVVCASSLTFVLIEGRALARTNDVTNFLRNPFKKKIA